MNKKRLVAEACVCIGMIDEAKAKCRGLKRQANKLSKQGCFDEAFEERLLKSLEQIKKDYHKYSRRLAKVYKELERYGLPKVE